MLAHELKEIRDNEVEAIKAIYMDSYEECAGSTGAWNVSICNHTVDCYCWF